MRSSRFVPGLLALLMGQPVIMVHPAEAQDLQVQDRAWVQIEAQPDLATAMERARAYSALFPQVQGYRLRTGWYGLAIGPLSSDDAVAQLHSLLAQNMIPADSYISDGAGFMDQFWPVGVQAQAPVVQPEPADPAVQPDPAAPAAQTGLPDESLAEARASEAALSAADRETLQTALKWFGFYAGRVDGNIGSGSHASMAAWQSAKGYEPTGILTSGQRKALVDGYSAEEAGFGFQTVTEQEAGVELSLPMAMLKFDRYTPPFVRYAAKDGSGVEAMLMSEPGTKASLSGLYDALQSLEMVPAGGERSLEANSFTIHSRNDKVETVAHAEIIGSNVKGYLLSWNVAQAEKMARVLPMIEASFRSTSDTAMDPGLVPLVDAVKRGLMDGLDAKQPKFATSGFFVDGQGSVLTAAASVADCGRVTLERGIPAKVSFSDKVAGIAVLTPEAPLAPKAVAGFASMAPAKGAAIAVSGYSWSGRLPAPVLTHGTMEEGQGLNGEAGVARLSVQTLPGDAGGPVLDDSGAVVGMLLASDPAAPKELPPGVVFAASASALTQILTNPQGPALTLNAGSGGTKETPDALNAAARGMTVLVSCW